MQGVDAFLLGLVILSIAIGQYASAIQGWMCFGSGLMILGIIVMSLRYLDGKK